MSAAETGRAPEAEGSAPVFSARVAALMVVVGVFAFSALVVLLAYAPDLERGDNGGAQALSKSAVGFAGLVQALRLAGDPALVNRAALRPGRSRGLLVITPGPTTPLSAIDGLRFAGPELVILPKWLTVAKPDHRGWVDRAELIEPRALPPGALLRSLAPRRGSDGARSVVLHAAGGADGLFPAGVVWRAGPVRSPQSIAAPGWVPVLADETGAVILARSPDRRRYVLADPDLMNTQGLKSLDTLGTALTILRTLRAGDGPVMFDVRLNGLGRERGALRLLFDPPFLAVTLCLAGAAALAGLQAFVRFGPVRRGGRVIPLGKTALVDNTAALIRLAGREHRMGGRYADLTAARAARAAGAPRSLGPRALEAFLDRLSARKGLPVPLSELAIQARMARTPEGVAVAARRLYQWRKAMAGRAGARP
jgi:hypothetical protein